MDTSVASQKALWLAHERLAAVHLGDVEGRWIALSELLWWIVVVDDDYERIDPGYRARRDAHSDGRKLPGARWARNRVTHQRALVVDTVRGAELGVLRVGVSRLGTRTKITWARAASLPPSDRRHDGGRDIYERFFEGRDVEPLLESLRSWLLVDGRTT